jgi:ankyrin repeat protein
MKPEWEKAARTGDLAAMRQILESSATSTNDIINSKDRHGQTALMLAAMRGHASVVDLLVARGAELNHAAKYNLSALMLAVINDHPAIVSVLVKARADTALKGNGAQDSIGRPRWT